jgi:hypothetical protein
LFNVPFATLGGKQFWGDELLWGGWRIQRHVLMGHYRLLDPDDQRHAWGSFESCRRRLEEIGAERQLAPVRGRVVLVLHGLGRTRASMQAICRRLNELPGTVALDVGYASTRAPVAEHARALARIIEHLPEAQQIDFVAHSMGNIVIRHYLADRARSGAAGPRIGRMVMIAPPNQGSLRAQAWSESKLFAFLFGQPGQELGAGWRQLQQRLAVPECEFGIVAGVRGDGRGWRSYLPGDDDGTVDVESTRLSGARDFLTVRSGHTLIMYHPEVIEATARFIEHGYFVDPQHRQPIP